MTLHSVRNDISLFHVSVGARAACQKVRGMPKWFFIFRMTWKLAKTLCRDNFEALSLSNIPFWLTHFSGPQSRKITRPCRHLRNSTARREARETENKSLNRKKQREISWNFTFTALADELLVSLFLKAWNTRKITTNEERSPLHPRLLFCFGKVIWKEMDSC